MDSSVIDAALHNHMKSLHWICSLILFENEVEFGPARKLNFLSADESLNQDSLSRE